MDLQQLFSASAFNIFWIPVIIGIFVIIALYFLRYFLYKYVRKLTVKTTTTFDDIMVRDTRIATLLWCIWLGVFTAYKLAETPQSWMNAENKIIPVLFVAIGLYTLIMVFVAIFKWYRCEICPRTGSSLDDYIMGILIYGTPILGGALGIIVILNILGYSSIEVNTWLAEHGPKIGLILVLAVALLLYLLSGRTQSNRKGCPQCPHRSD